MAESFAMSETGGELRCAARAGFEGLTIGRAPGFVQANLVLLPEADADDFEAFCRANAIACPLIAHSRPGDPHLTALGDDFDFRTDLPVYLVHREGVPTRTADGMDVCRDDLVAFAIGCRFGAESALRAAGIKLRQVELGIQGPLFRTDRATTAARPFGGPLVVSMCPFAERDVETVMTTSCMPLSHGAPLDRGDPSGLGIRDPDRSHWGKPLAPEPGEVALYRGCGLTALAALGSAGIPFFITHLPGAVLVTDLVEETARWN